MAANDEKPKSRLLSIFRVIKWCTKWGATAGGIFSLIYILNNFVFIEYSVINPLFVLGIIFTFFVMLAPRSWQIKFIKIFQNIFIIIFILCISLYIFIFAIIIYFPDMGSSVAKNITKEKILSLKIGMDIQDIEKIFGQPIFDENDDYSGHKLFYAISGIAEGGFEFYLHFDYSNKLDCIHISKDGDGVYQCYHQFCYGIINNNAFEEFISLSIK